MLHFLHKTETNRHSVLLYATFLLNVLKIVQLRDLQHDLSPQFIACSVYCNWVTQGSCIIWVGIYSRHGARPETTNLLVFKHLQKHGSPRIALNITHGEESKRFLHIHTIVSRTSYQHQCFLLTQWNVPFNINNTRMPFTGASGHFPSPERSANNIMSDGYNFLWSTDQSTKNRAFL